MFLLDNRSGYQAALYPGWSASGTFQYTLVIKHGWQYQADGSLQAIKTAEPIVTIDRYYAKPLTSSIAQASEVMPYKAHGEWLLTGTIKKQYKKQGLHVAIRNMQQTLKKSLIVNFKYSDDSHLPLRYEFARRSLKNPVGLPRHLNAPLRASVLDKNMAAFAPIAPFWPTRQKYCNSADSYAVEHAVQASTNSALTYNVAPKEQQFRMFLRGEQELMLSGFYEKSLHIMVPEQQFVIGERNSSNEYPAQCDTLTIDIDKQAIYKLWRAAIPSTLNENQQHTVVLEAGK